MLKKLILTFGFILFAANVFAATTPNSAIMPQTPGLGLVQFLQGTDTAGTYKTLYTAGTNGSVIKSLVATSNDPSAAHLVTCQIVRSAVKYGLVATTIPVSAGFANATPSINMLAQTVTVSGLPLDSDSNPFFFMASGDTLQCTFATSLTASDVINILAVAADF